MSRLPRGNFNQIERPFARVCDFCGLLAVVLGVVVALVLYGVLALVGVGERWEG